MELNTSYPGGLEEYCKRAKLLLKASAEDVNPYDKYTPSVPDGENISIHSHNFNQLEQTGLQQIKHTGSF